MLERFDHLIAVSRLGVDPQLGEDVVLSFDARHGFLDVSENRAVKQKAGIPAFDLRHKHLLVKRVGDGLAFLFGIRQSPERVEKSRPGVNDGYRNPKSGEQIGHPARLAFTHQGVVHKNGFQLRPQRPVRQRGHDRTVHPAADGVDGASAADLLANGGDLILNELFVVHGVARRFHCANILR